MLRYLEIFNFSKEWIKETARPEYWLPDKDCVNCFVCKQEFNDKLPIHHCRACGQGVCDPCSQTRMKVPSRGWDQEVRTCDDCQKKLSVHWQSCWHLTKIFFLIWLLFNKSPLNYYSMVYWLQLNQLFVFSSSLEPSLSIP